MSPKEIFTHLSLSYIYTCGSGSVFGIRIRIQKAPEYGSGSTILMIAERKANISMMARANISMTNKANIS